MVSSARLTLEFEDRGDGTVMIAADCGDQPIYVDVVDVQRSDERDRYASELRARCPAVSKEDIDEKLLAIANQAGPTNGQTRATPKQTDRARIEFSPVPASQLGNGADADWLWRGYLARGSVTLLVGLWKGGKSTLLSHLLQTMGTGGTLAGEVGNARALVITEEGSVHWRRRRDALGIGDHVHFLIRPFRGRPTQSEWESYVQRIAEVVKQGDYDVLVIDTWQSVNPCRDENDAAGTMAAVLPLQTVAEAGAAVLLLHHPRKGDAAEGQASRGSGALPGFVDTIIELRRFNAEDAGDRRRTLTSLSRFEEAPPEVVIELTEQGYLQVGSKSDAKQADRQEVIDEILSDGYFRTTEEVREAWPEGVIVKPGKRTIELDLKVGYDNSRWQRKGGGKKGSPYRYGFDSRMPPSLDAPNETNGETTEAPT